MKAQLRPLAESRVLFAGVALIACGVALMALGRDDTGTLLLFAGIGMAGVRAAAATGGDNGTAKT